MLLFFTSRRGIQKGKHPWIRKILRSINKIKRQPKNKCRGKFMSTSSTKISDIQENTGFRRPQSTYTVLLRGCQKSAKTELHKRARQFSALNGGGARPQSRKMIYLDIISQNKPSYGSSKNLILIQNSFTKQKWYFSQRQNNTWMEKSPFFEENEDHVEKRQNNSLWQHSKKKDFWRNCAKVLKKLIWIYVTKHSTEKCHDRTSIYKTSS